MFGEGEKFLAQMFYIICTKKKKKKKKAARERIGWPDADGTVCFLKKENEKKKKLLNWRDFQQQLCLCIVYQNINDTPLTPAF